MNDKELSARRSPVWLVINIELHAGANELCTAHREERDERLGVEGALCEIASSKEISPLGPLVGL